MAWDPLGFEPVAFSEVEPFPSAVLAQHYPDVPNLGDMTRIDGRKYNGSVDLLVGGTPCQSFSVAGLRGGMADPRGNLALAFLGLVDTIRPRYFVWENVPGVLSSSGGRDFGSFVSAVAQLGYRGGWRVLDAQYFGLAQRRKRVFFIGCSPAAERGPREVLLESEGLRGDSPPSRETREEAAGVPGVGSALNAHGGSCGRSFVQNSRDEVRLMNGDGEIAGSLAAEPGAKQQTYIAFDARQSDVTQYGDKAGPLDTDGYSQGIAVDVYNGEETGEVAASLTAAAGGSNTSGPKVMAFAQNQVGDLLTGPVAPAMGTNQSSTGRGTAKALILGAVRRLTPRECERLQGFPDDYTRIAWRGKAPEDCPDGPRYKALGNSMAVPVMRWIGERLREAKS